MVVVVVVVVVVAGSVGEVVDVPALLSSRTVVVVVVAGSVGEVVDACMQHAAQWSSKSGWSPVLIPGLARTVPRDSMVTKVTVSFIFNSQNLFSSCLEEAGE